MTIPNGDHGLAGALALAFAVITGALLFEHVGGLAPCPLCLQQRYAYYAGIPGILGAIMLDRSGQRQVAAIVAGLVILGFLANAGLAGYHAGVEWKLWEGPTTCSATVSVWKPVGGSLLDALKSGPPVIRCDEAAWRFFGLSLAGWNVLASLAIAALVGGRCLKRTT